MSFTSDRYDVGIIPCTDKKRPTGLTPATLYMGRSFAAMVRHAGQRCDTVLVMSAKYGLLRLDDPVRYYEVYLPDLDSGERGVLAALIRLQAATTFEREIYGEVRPPRILSYLSKAYFELLGEAIPLAAATIRRPYKKLGRITFATLNLETKNYGKNPAMR